MTVNIATNVLNQLKTLLVQLTDEDLATQLLVFNGSSLGKHSRHVVEFFQCLMKSTTEGVVNYDARTRDLRLEEDVKYSIKVLDKITECLTKNSFDNINISLVSEFGNEQRIAVLTNFNRELIYLIEHSVHHFALMRIGVQENFPHVYLSNDFGVVDSTIKHLNNF
jgi:uncharacterized SAM-dependent methyltransferase